MSMTPTISASSGNPLACRIAACLFLVMAALPVQAQDGRGPSEESKPFTAFSNSVHSFRDSLATIARAQVGTKYVTGGQSPEGGFDCSGLIKYVMAGLHVHLPRTAAQQATSGLAIQRDRSRLRPGDLLTFGNGARGVSHIGIYVGNGRFVHASSVAGRVIESDVERPSSSLIRKWRGVRRVVATEADSASGSRGDS